MVHACLCLGQVLVDQYTAHTFCDKMQLLNRHQEEMKAARERHEAQAEQLHQQLAQLQVRTLLSVRVSVHVCVWVCVCLCVHGWVVWFTAQCSLGMMQ